MNDEMERAEVEEFVDSGGALEPVGTTELAVRDAQWLKPWQWVVGLLPVLWVAWQATETVRSYRGKGTLVSHRQARRMHFLQLLSVAGQAMVFGHGWYTYVSVALLSLLVFLTPFYTYSMKQLPEGE